ncbi:hypothetical protein [Roseimarinus sediminis]|uniref:hypothetical protein n=1 Tax=Roseimarinus sediminis TaxID=1610899 RepID=UPI003D1D499C
MNANRLSVLIILLILFSCNDAEQSIVMGHTKYSETNILDNIPFIQNPYDVEHYLEVYEDDDDERINRSLYELSLISREILKTGDWNELIISKAKENLSATMSLNDFVSISNLKSGNMKIMDLKHKLKTIDLTHVSRNPYKSGVVEKYIPAFYAPNIDVADFTKQAIISPGVEVNSELAKVAHLEDYIVCWIYNENGELQEFLINEEIAMKTTHPIFIVDNASEELMNVPSSYRIDENELHDPILKSASYQFGIDIHEYNLDYRFEGSGNSEYWVQCLHIWPDGEDHGPERKLTRSIEREIAVVDKDDIGEDLTTWYHLAAADYTTPLDDHGIFWNTYERDWFRSEKPLGEPEYNGTKLYYYGNMHYDSDWYGFKPEDIMDSWIDLETLYNSWAIWYSSSHSTARLWRTNY